MSTINALLMVVCAGVVADGAGRHVTSPARPALAVSHAVARDQEAVAQGPQAPNGAGQASTNRARTFDDVIDGNAKGMLAQGRRIFRFDTFGDEAFWSDTLKLHLAIAGQKLGGVGPGVSPATALAVGLKVDSDALPPSVLQAITRGQVNLDDPAVTLALLDANAVVGVTGHRGPDRRLASVGIQCSLCHSTSASASRRSAIWSST